MYRLIFIPDYQGFYTVFSPFAIWFFSVDPEFFKAEISHNGQYLNARYMFLHHCSPIYIESYFMTLAEFSTYLSSRTAPTFENIALAIFILCVVALVFYLDSH